MPGSLIRPGIFFSGRCGACLFPRGRGRDRTASPRLTRYGDGNFWGRIATSNRPRQEGPVGADREELCFLEIAGIAISENMAVQVR